jgi:hypothetical protein
LNAVVFTARDSLARRVTGDRRRAASVGERRVRKASADRRGDALWKIFHSRSERAFRPASGSRKHHRRRRVRARL